MAGIRPARSSGRRARRKGSAAVEFALVALPFFGLILATLEVGAILLTDAVLETATADAGRQVRTGQAQLQKITPEALKARLCSNMSLFSYDCSNRAHIDIRTVDTYTSPLVPDPLENGTFDPSVMDYQPGSPGDYVMVRVWYEHPVATPFMAQALARTTDHKVMLTTSLAFRNEPYL